MIPEFPKFKKLELADRNDIEKITSKFPPYSDFNFVSMWSWNINDEMRVSILHKNLVVKFTDYITRKPFYSFLGDNKVNDTVKSLLELSREEKLKPELRLLPEHSILSLDKSKYEALEDVDNFDYIYTVAGLSGMKGSKYETHRNLIHQFEKKYTGWEAKTVDLAHSETRSAIITLFDSWTENKKDTLSVKEYENEFLSLKRLLTIKNPNLRNLSCFALYVDKKMIGFIINESVGSGYNIIHFEKADTTFKGCYSFLMQQNARNLQSLNLQYINFEQDLGISSLRFTKNKFRPSSFLKKYLIGI